jgi:hypothetical protein
MRDIAASWILPSDAEESFALHPLPLSAQVVQPALVVTAWPALPFIACAAFRRLGRNAPFVPADAARLLLKLSSGSLKCLQSHSGNW